jgi:DNA-binding NtrC family response regulator
VLHQVNGNRMKAAKVLGISRRALYRRLNVINSKTKGMSAHVPRAASS